MRAMRRHALKILTAAAAVLSLTACGTAPVRRRVPAPPPSALDKALIRTARSYLPEEDAGRPTPKDCSDFVDRVFREHGVKLPRTAAAMSARGKAVVSSQELRMGDLLFFAGSKGGRKVGHVAIYVNNCVFIHQANPGEGVRMESLYSDYYRKRYLGARRVVN
jgi:cell wall-associated NlpC family hydrolase